MEKQLDLYWCGIYQEPPTDFASVIANGGSQIIPTLLEQVKAEKSETRQDLIIHIFEEMAKKGHLAGRHDIAAQLRQLISAMKDDDIRKTSQQRLQSIEENL